MRQLWTFTDSVFCAYFAGVVGMTFFSVSEALVMAAIAFIATMPHRS